MARPKPFKCTIKTGITRPYDKPAQIVTHGPYWRRGVTRDEVVANLRNEFAELESGARTIIDITASSVSEDVFCREMVRQNKASMLPGIDLDTGTGEKPGPVTWRRRGDIPTTE